MGAQYSKICCYYDRSQLLLFLTGIGLAYDSSILKDRKSCDYLYVQQDGSFSTGAAAKIISKVNDQAAC